MRKPQRHKPNPRQTMTLALIPARAGSKSIKNKNLAPLANHPLIYYTIEAAKAAACIDKIVVSSDGEAILDYAASQNIEILKRPKELATDSTQSHEVLLHALEHYKECEHVVLLQPTSPLRTSEDIDRAYKIFVSKKANALLSVCKVDSKILKSFMANENGELRGIANNTYPFMPRQNLPQTYQSNGAIYIVKRELFVENPSFLPEHTHYYLMEEEASLDIDIMVDLQKAESRIKHNKEEKA